MSPIGLATFFPLSGVSLVLFHLLVTVFDLAMFFMIRVILGTVSSSSNIVFANFSIFINSAGAPMFNASQLGSAVSLMQWEYLAAWNGQRWRIGNDHMLYLQYYYRLIDRDAFDWILKVILEGYIRKIFQGNL